MTRVVVVEDSLVQRAHLVHVLQAEGDIVVVGEATGGSEAVQMVEALRPDVVTLDLQIPGGGGQHAIEQIMAFTPTPILVLSATVSRRGSQEAVAALMSGAMEALPKPDVWNAAEEQALRDRVRALRRVTVVRHPRGRRATTPAPAGREPSADRGTAVVAIGASAGGPAALAVVLSDLAGLRASVLVVQHIHGEFVGGLVSWMARVSSLPVELARHGAQLQAGVVYIAPGGVHMKLGIGQTLVLDGKPESIHRPSVDVLFSSLARATDARRVGVILTGMGEDGAAGLLELRRSHALTIAQDEATSSVYGMPQAAQRLGAASRVLPLSDIGPAIRHAL